MSQYTITPNNKGVWPTNLIVINCNSYDSIAWISPGKQKGPDVRSFNPSGWVTYIKTQGNKTTADLVRPPERKQISYLITNSSEDTPAQIELDIDGEDCEDPQSEASRIRGFLRAILSFFRNLFGR